MLVNASFTLPFAEFISNSARAKNLQQVPPETRLPGESNLISLDSVGMKKPPMMMITCRALESGRQWTNIFTRPSDKRLRAV